MEEIKKMLRTVLEAQQVTSAKIEAVEKRMENIENRMEKGFSELKQGQKDVQAEIREDIHTLIELYGEQQHEVRKLKRKVREAQ